MVWPEAGSARHQRLHQRPDLGAAETAGTTDGAVAQALHSGTFRVFGVEARFDAEGNLQGPLGEPALWV